MKIKRYESDGRFCKAVIYNGVLYMAGMTSGAEGKDRDITEQTQIVLAKIERVLQQYGSGKGKLLSATIYLEDMSMKDAMDTVWKKWVVPGEEPARTTVQATLSTTGSVLIEISIIAAA